MSARERIMTVREAHRIGKSWARVSVGEENFS